MKPTYAKLHILLASEAPVGLVIRHGTAQSVCTLLWNRKKDTFALGQWMRGRIHPGCCDLSPDGNHFLYGAKKYSDPNLLSWTAISRTPYLKAVAYYPGRHGGWFVNNHEYCVPDWMTKPHPDDRESPEVRRVPVAPPRPACSAVG